MAPRNKIFIVLVLVLALAFALVAPRAQNIIHGPIMRTIAAAGGSCATSDTVLAHDEMVFGWESGDSPTPWTGPTSFESGDAVTFDTAYDTSALTTSKPAGACNTGLRVTLTGTSGTDTYYFDKGSIIGPGVNQDYVFYVYVQTAFSARMGMVVGGESIDAASSADFTITLRDNSGTPEIRGESITDSSFVALNTGSWNKVAVHVDATAALSSIAANDGTPATFTTSASLGVRYLHAGVNFASAGRSGQVVIDLFAVNTP